MMATLPLVTGARTCAALSVDLFVVLQSPPKSVCQRAETESVPATRRAMTTILSMTMAVAAPAAPQSLAGSAKP